MEYAELFDLGRIGQTHALLPGRMAPAQLLFELAIIECAIVNGHIGMAQKGDKCLIGSARRVLGIGGIDKALAFGFGFQRMRTARMRDGHRADRQAADR